MFFYRKKKNSTLPGTWIKENYEGKYHTYYNIKEDLTGVTGDENDIPLVFSLEKTIWHVDAKRVGAKHDEYNFDLNFDGKYMYERYNGKEDKIETKTVHFILDGDRMILLEINEQNGYLIPAILIKSEF